MATGNAKNEQVKEMSKKMKSNKKHRRLWGKEEPNY